MWKRVARGIVPGSFRRFLQRRKLEKQIQTFPRRIVEHFYGDIRLRIELADGLGEGWYDHDWEPLPELNLMCKAGLRQGARVFDLGAHQGVVGLMIGHRVGPTGSVILVEANAHNILQCKRNVELNAMPWVVARHAAASDKPGKVVFNGGLNGAVAEVSDYAGRVEVPAVTVDSLAAEYGKPDVLFVDVEGFECRVLAGAEQTLSTNVDWFLEAHVGCGLEAAGGSADQILKYFPNERYKKWIHCEEDREPVPLEHAGEKLKTRFFLTALARSGSARF